MQGFDVVESGSSLLTATVSRRDVLRKAAGIGAFAAITGLGLTLTGRTVSAQESAKYKTTSALNLRTGPGPRRRVILVIPSGALVDLVGSTKNGYRHVAYNGTRGWAYADFLEASDGGSSDGPVMIGTAKTTDSVNFRNQPSLSGSVLSVLAAGTTVEVFNVTSNGYRMVGHAQIPGWIHEDYLGGVNGGSDVPVPVGTARTNDSVNFRNQPSTSATVIQVLPANTTVDVFDVYQNGFRMVGYTQITGWIYADYLGDEGGPLGGYVVTTTALNLREEASTSSRVLAVMPEGAKAFRGDVIANGFLGVTYNGISGWAYMDYLKSV